jgi:hypothetical protein
MGAAKWTCRVSASFHHVSEFGRLWPPLSVSNALFCGRPWPPLNMLFFVFNFGAVFFTLWPFFAATKMQFSCSEGTLKVKLWKAISLIPFSIPPSYRKIDYDYTTTYDPVHSCDIHNQTTQYSFMVFVRKNTVLTNTMIILKIFHRNHITNKNKLYKYAIILSKMI